MNKREKTDGDWKPAEAFIQVSQVRVGSDEPFHPLIFRTQKRQRSALLRFLPAAASAALCSVCLQIFSDLNEEVGD